MKVVFVGIQWDTDGQVPDMELPTEFQVEVDNAQQAREVINNDYANLLSDEYGYCIDSMGHVEVYDDNGNLIQL